MRRYTNRFINEHNLISGRVLSAIVVLPLSLTIAACSQPNSAAADSTPATEPTVATHTEQPTAEIMPVSAPSDTQSTILKKISQPPSIKMRIVAAAKNGSVMPKVMV